MVRKPNCMYRKLAKKAYTRKEYMGGIPGIKVVQFDMGNLQAEFPMEVHLIVDESCQIRHSALEAARMSINRKLNKELGRLFFVVLPVIFREEQIIFPEIVYDQVESIRGLQVTIVTSAKNNQQALVLFKALGMPFAKK